MNKHTLFFIEPLFVQLFIFYLALRDLGKYGHFFCNFRRAKCGGYESNWHMGKKTIIVIYRIVLQTTFRLFYFNIRKNCLQNNA